MALHSVGGHSRQSDIQPTWKGLVSSRVEATVLGYVGDDAVFFGCRGAWEVSSDNSADLGIGLGFRTWALGLP